MVVAVVVPIFAGAFAGSGVIERVLRSYYGTALPDFATYLSFCAIVLLAVITSSVVYPRARIVVLSILLCVVTLSVVYELMSKDSISGFAGFVIGQVLLVPCDVVSVLAGLFVVFIRRTVLLQQVLRNGLTRCPGCRYSLEGLDWKLAKCPECGLHLWELHILFSRYRFRWSHFIDWK